MSHAKSQRRKEERKKNDFCKKFNLKVFNQIRTDAHSMNSWRLGGMPLARSANDKLRGVA